MVCSHQANWFLFIHRKKNMKNGEEQAGGRLTNMKLIKVKKLFGTDVFWDLQFYFYSSFLFLSSNSWQSLSVLKWKERWLFNKNLFNHRDLCEKQSLECDNHHIDAQTTTFISRYDRVRLSIYIFSNVVCMYIFSWTIIIIQFTTIQMFCPIQVYCHKLSKETSRSDWFYIVVVAAVSFLMVHFFFIVATWLIWLNAFVCGLRLDSCGVLISHGKCMHRERERDKI